MKRYEAAIENLQVIHDQLRRLDQLACGERSQELLKVMFEIRERLETHLQSEQRLQDETDYKVGTEHVDQFVQQALENLGCEVKHLGGFLTVHTKSGETWGFTVPQKVKV